MFFVDFATAHHMDKLRQLCYNIIMEKSPIKTLQDLPRLQINGQEFPVSEELRDAYVRIETDNELIKHHMEQVAQLAATIFEYLETHSDEVSTHNILPPHYIADMANEVGGLNGSGDAPSSDARRDITLAYARDVVRSVREISPESATHNLALFEKVDPEIDGNGQSDPFLRGFEIVAVPTRHVYAANLSDKLFPPRA
jgi:hypothetical protein